jgi:Uma2 family endonuclease
MNELFTPPRRRAPTQSAEGLPRWHWTVAEVERVAAAGIFTDHDRFELVGGEMVPMSPEGRRHAILRAELTFRISELAVAAGNLMVVAEPQFNLSSDSYLVPDILVHPRSIKTYDLRPADAVLVVEIADTSLNYDTGTKMPLYAVHGVPEYWVINAATLVTTVYRQPSDDSYTSTQEIPGDALLVPARLPELAVRLNALSLE